MNVVGIADVDRERLAGVRQLERLGLRFAQVGVGLAGGVARDFVVRQVDQRNGNSP